MLGSSSLFGKSAAAPTTQPPGFGSMFGATPATTQAQFGAPTPAFGAPAQGAFGAQAAPAFGAPAQSGFGAQPQLQFGAAAPATPAFGAPLATTTAQSLPSLNFGLTGFKPTTTSTTQPSIFGVSKAPTLGFSTATTQSLNFGLGSNAKPSTGFTLGTPATTAPLTFGLSTPATTAATTQAPTLNFGLGSTLTPTTTSQPTLNFGLGSTLTSTPQTSFGIGLQTTTTQSFGAPTTTAPSLGLGALPLTPATTAGVNPLSSLSSLGADKSTKPEQKDRPVPPELVTQIEALREFVKLQKSHSSEVSQASLKPILKVNYDADILKRMTSHLERDLGKNRVLNKKLRADLGRSIQDCEIVQRLSANQRGFPCDNSIAFDYFLNIISRFQAQSETLSSELKDMERQVSCRLNPAPFTPEELTISMKRLYECFVALAGRYQAIHSSITALKLEVRRRKEQQPK